LSAALFADFDAIPPKERNYARWIFLDEAARSLFVDWRDQASGAVESLRFEVGDLTVEYESLALPGDPDTMLYVYTTEPDSPSRRAMDILASWTASGPGARLTRSGSDTEPES
jgi:hypothetical protein